MGWRADAPTQGASAATFFRGAAFLEACGHLEIDEEMESIPRFSLIRRWNRNIALLPYVTIFVTFAPKTWIATECLSVSAIRKRVRLLRSRPRVMLKTA